jgi:hypothetical protein
MREGELGTVLETRVLSNRFNQAKVIADNAHNEEWHDEGNLELIEAPKFEVGDKVSWCGVEGVVSWVYPDCDFTVKTNFAGYIQHFTPEGKHLPWHKEPSLILVEKWKPLKKEIEVGSDMHAVALPEEFRGKKVKITIEEIK